MSGASGKAVMEYWNIGRMVLGKPKIPISKSKSVPIIFL